MEILREEIYVQDQSRQLHISKKEKLWAADSLPSLLTDAFRQPLVSHPVTENELIP